MEIFIVAHNQDLILNFKDGNYTNFHYILVGEKPKYSKLGHHCFLPPYQFRIKKTNEIIYIPDYSFDNIEKYPNLLTFTAWYWLAKNYEFQDNDYVGIFEYDIKIHKDLSELEPLLRPNRIVSFLQYPITNQYSFNPEYIQGLIDSIKKVYHIDIIKLLDDYSADTVDAFWWGPTTNHIMPVKFLKGFVDWYLKLIPEIVQYPNYPHFHERALKIYSILNGYHNIYKPEYLTHEQLGSHRIPLFPEQFNP